MSHRHSELKELLQHYVSYGKKALPPNSFQRKKVEIPQKSFQQLVITDDPIIYGHEVSSPRLPPRCRELL